MGRLSRHRKIKSCDPFYKGHREVDISSNAPVNPSELDSQPIPRKAKHLFKSSRKLAKTGKNVSEKDRKKSKAKLNLIRREDETWKEYYQRLDKQAAAQVARILVKETHVNQKRKEFFKARKERSSKKRRNVGQEEYMDFTTDNVKFGEVVYEPPNLTSKPRHADSKTDTKSKRKVDSLLLKSKLETSNSAQEHENGSQSLVKSKKRKHMSGFERQVSDKRRLDAIAAYRKLKEKKVVKAKT